MCEVKFDLGSKVKVKSDSDFLLSQPCFVWNKSKWLMIKLSYLGLGAHRSIPHALLDIGQYDFQVIL